MHKTHNGGFMRVRTKSGSPVGRPRKFNEAEALKRMQRQLLSGTFLDGIARSAGLNRPSPPRATKPGRGRGLMRSEQEIKDTNDQWIALIARRDALLEAVRAINEEISALNEKLAQGPEEVVYKQE